MFRKCPCCGKRVGLWIVLGPGFTNGGPVICKHCGSVISLPWWRYSHIGFLGLVAAMATTALVKKEELGLDSYVAYAFIMGVAVLTPLTLAIYAFFPLKRQAPKDNID